MAGDESKAQAALERWLAALEKRHYAELTFQEVRKGLQAVSAIYVQKRDKLAEGAVFEGRGKRAAFAIFYGPLHFMAVRAVIRELGAADPPPTRIADLGCGTGVAGAAWALEAGGAPAIEGTERHSWASGEARLTFQDLGVKGRTHPGDFTRASLPPKGGAVVAAWAVNELDDAARAALLPKLLACGARVLIAEPIAKSPVPWWGDWVAAFTKAGGRADEWRFPVELPETLAKLDKAAHLDHRVLSLRTLFLPG